MKSEVLSIVYVLLALAIIFFGLMSMRVPGAGTHNKVNLLYIAAGGLCIGVLGFVQLAGLSGKTYLFFIILQLLLLGLGMLNTFCLYKFLPWSSRTSFWGPLLITLAVAALGSALLLLAFELSGMKHFHFILLSAVSWFVVPLFFINAVEHYGIIPERQFKIWAYPVAEQVADPTDAEMASPLVISFEFRKRVNDPSITIFRAKAPKDITFGKLFYFFINDYNSRHPEGCIEFVSDGTLPHPWVFHFRKKWFSAARYLDPDETVYHNHVKENSVIVCQRIIEP